METNGRELLENVTITSDENGSPQYMIQRMSVENAQLLSSELLQHNGIVVDLEGDFIPVNYTSEDLLPHDLTDEDRNLAAALVAVQFSQQQKPPPPQQDGSVIINTSLPSLVSTSGLDASKVTLGDQQVLLQHKQGYIQIVDAENLYKQTKFAQYEDSSSLLIKSEEDMEGGILHRDSDGDNREQRTAKKSLPHKKRISRKLKKGDKNSIRKLQKCTLCDQTFTLEEFTEHQELCQTTITPLPNVFACQLCNCSFADQLQFFEHLKVHYEPSAQEETTTVVETNIPTIQEAELKLQQEPQKNTLLTTLLQLSCLECNKTFRRQRTYDQHIKDFHIKEDLNEFSEPEDLMAGIDVHPAEDDEDNKAWYQDELDATEEDLKELEAKEHVCQNCQQPFPIRAILLQHMVTCTDTYNVTKEVSADVKKKKGKKAELECTICNRKFIHRNSLVYHLRSHTGHRPHQCEQCGKSFFTASALKVHLRLHSGDKPYRCEFCGRHFRQWGDLKYHCISIHSDQKQYQCEYCGKDFARKYSLIVHRRIHTGEKNYRCEFCGKTFRASSYLQNHRRIHTGEKPHPCEICGKRFRVRSDMKRHVRTHARRRTTRRITLPSELKLEDMPQESNVESGLKTAESDGARRRCDNAIHGIHLTMSPNLKLEDLPQESDVESILKTAENDAAVQSLQYEQEALDTVRDGTLYVMPILIT